MFGFHNSCPGQVHNRLWKFMKKVELNFLQGAKNLWMKYVKFPLIIRWITFTTRTSLSCSTEWDRIIRIFAEKKPVNQFVEHHSKSTSNVSPSFSHAMPADLICFTFVSLVLRNLRLFPRPSRSERLLFFAEIWLDGQYSVRTIDTMVVL